LLTPFKNRPCNEFKEKGMSPATPKAPSLGDNSPAAHPGPSATKKAGGDPTALYELTAEERHARIAEVAHRIAQRRGGAPGSELADWLEAEREVDADRPSNEVV
jgi:hypothetical protein